MYLIRFMKKDKSYGYQVVCKDYSTQTRAKEFINEEQALILVKCGFKMLEPYQSTSEIVYDDEKGFIKKDIKGD